MPRTLERPPGAAGMTKEMIISSSAHETRVAILEEDQVAEVFIERERSRGVAGNLYKGRVSKVLPGMQSAFVDLGLERDGFLYVTDVVNTAEMFEQLEGDDEDEPPASLLAANAEAAAAEAAATTGGAAALAGSALTAAVPTSGEQGPRPRDGRS